MSDARPKAPFDLNNPTHWILPGILPNRGVALVTGESGALKTSFVLWALANAASLTDDDDRDIPELPQLRAQFGLTPEGADRVRYFAPAVTFFALESEDQTAEAIRTMAGRVADAKVDAKVDAWFLRADGSLNLYDTPLLVTPRHPDCEHTFDLCADADGDNSLFNFKDAAADYGRSFEDTQVVVVDSIACALNGRSENESSTMSMAARGLSYLRPGYEGAGLVIGIHHGNRSHNKWHSRGHTALPSAVDCVVNIARRGDTIIVKNLKARGFAEGASRTYRAELVEWGDLECADLSVYRAYEFVEVPTTMPSTKPNPPPDKASAAPSASNPAPKHTEASADTDTPATKAPKLRGLPHSVWVDLGLKPGDSLALDAAQAKALAGTALSEVSPRRQAQKWREVLASFTGKGLVVAGCIVHP